MLLFSYSAFGTQLPTKLACSSLLSALLLSSISTARVTIRDFSNKPILVEEKAKFQNFLLLIKDISKKIKMEISHISVFTVSLQVTRSPDGNSR